MVFSITVDALPQLLTVQKSGTGTGTVTATGIDCGSDCTEAYNNGSSVVLTANPSADPVFGGWTGCDLPMGGSCTMTMTADKTVLATFNPPPNFTTITFPRSEALKKCKKIKKRKARKRCNRRAKKLPIQGI